ncbi:MAG: tRNA lysidine(34) synthetase TilS [Deltaproteobacteria bacterium]|nr:tRNA lysidine(34) synthetase TilS [Deltaproteobacteria bacterium]
MKTQSVLETIRQSLETLNVSGERILLAVSGGSDSMAMLHLVRKLCEPDMLRVACVDHGFRPEAEKEWQLVRHQCDGLGVSSKKLCITEKYDESQTGCGLQQWARDRRYALLREEANRFNCRAVLTAHTLDDQAETVMLRLMRGTGLDGLGAMMAKRDLGEGVFLFRPLLGIERVRLREWLCAQDIPWVEDPSNENMRFARVQARKLLPELAKSSPRIRHHLCALAGEAQAVTNWLDVTLAIKNMCTPLLCNHGIRVDRDVFAQIPLPLHGRIVRQALQYSAGHLRRFERNHIIAIVNGLHSSGRTREFDLPGEFRACTSYGELYVFPQKFSPSVSFAGQNMSQVSSNEWMGHHSEMGVTVKVNFASSLERIFDEEMERMENRELIVRPLKNGDHVYKSSRKVAKLLVEHRIPSFYRPFVPGLATTSGEIISIPGILKSRISGLRMEWHLHANCVLKDLRQFASI